MISGSRRQTLNNYLLFVSHNCFSVSVRSNEKRKQNSCILILASIDVNVHMHITCCHHCLNKQLSRAKRNFCQFFLILINQNEFSQINTESTLPLRVIVWIMRGFFDYSVSKFNEQRP